MHGIAAHNIAIVVVVVVVGGSEVNVIRIAVDWFQRFNYDIVDSGIDNDDSNNNNNNVFTYKSKLDKNRCSNAQTTSVHNNHQFNEIGCRVTSAILRISIVKSNNRIKHVNGLCSISNDLLLV